MNRDLWIKKWYRVSFQVNEICCCIGRTNQVGLRSQKKQMRLGILLGNWLMLLPALDRDLKTRIWDWVSFWAADLYCCIRRTEWRCLEKHVIYVWIVQQTRFWANYCSLKYNRVVFTVMNMQQLLPTHLHIPIAEGASINFGCIVLYNRITTW